MIEPIGIDTRETQHGIRGRMEGDLAFKRRDECVEKAARRADDRRHPGRREDLAECPDRPADVVSDMRFVEPMPVVTHEVAHAAAVLAGCRVQKRQRPIQDRRPLLLVFAARELERDDDETRHIVHAVAGFAVGDDTVCVLHDSDVVDKGEQMIPADVGELQRDGGQGRPAGREHRCFAQDRGGRLGDGRPRELTPDPARFVLSRFERTWLLDQLQNAFRQSVDVAERNQPARSGGEKVFRVPVRGRDGRAACGYRKRQRA